MHLGRRLTMALATTTLSLTCALATAMPAGATGGTDDAGRTPDAPLAAHTTPTPPVLDVAPATAAREEVPLAKRAARPLFAFWGKKYMRLDGFGFTTAVRGSGTGVQIDVAWKTYRGVRPILPKVFVQSRTDGGKWTKVKGVKAKIGKQLVRARMPAHTVPAGVVAQQVDYRLKTKKPTSGPRRARRSVTSDRISVRFENQSMYAGDQLRFYQPIATLCPNASVTIDTADLDITEERTGVFSWRYGITIDAAALALSPCEPEESKLGISIHECAHMKQFYNWGGTNQSWDRLVARSAEVFVADNNPDPNVVTVPMAPDWVPLEHAADCAKELISPERYRTYGGYCNPTESAAASLLWQNLKY